MKKTIIKIRRSSSACRSTGVTLVEMMIALLLSLILVGALGSVYLSAKQTYTMQTALATVEENGRYALQLLLQDIRRAGYLGEILNVNTITGTAPPTQPTYTCPTDTRWGRMLQQSIYGLNDAIRNSSRHDYSACIPDNDYLLGDIVAVRYVLPKPLDRNTLRNRRNADRMYLRSNPAEGRLFSGKNHRENELSDTFSVVRQLAAYAYYIGPSLGRDTNFGCQSDAPIPALYRERLTSKGLPQREEVVRGIENLQVRYGVDPDNDGSVNRYKDAHQVTHWDRVIAVRIWILARAECPELGYTSGESYELGDQIYTPGDAYRRYLFTSTVAIRSRQKENSTRETAKPL